MGNWKEYAVSCAENLSNFSGRNQTVCRRRKIHLNPAGIPVREYGLKDLGLFQNGLEVVRWFGSVADPVIQSLLVYVKALIKILSFRMVTSKGFNRFPVSSSSGIVYANSEMSSIPSSCSL